MNLIPRLLLSSLLATLIADSPTRAEDWPQWLGPQRDSVWRESGIVDAFPAQGPRGSGSRSRLWLRRARRGPRTCLCGRLSRPGNPLSEADRRDKLEGQERVLCLAADTGQLLWKHEYPCTYRISYPYGPRVTPTVDQDRVYTLGAEGKLLCLRVADGSVVWSKQLTEDYDCDADLGFCRPSADRRRPTHLPGGRRGKCRRGTEQAHRRGDMACLVGQRAWLLPSNHHRGRRNATATDLAPRIAQQPEPRDRQSCTGARNWLPTRACRSPRRAKMAPTCLSGATR